MKARLKNLQNKIDRYMQIVNSHSTGAYAAQAAYFFMLSLIPIILLLMTLVQYTPVTQEDVISAVRQVFPSTVEGFIISIVRQVYAQSVTIIPVTILVALWSAGKGVLSVTSGLNKIYEKTETRNYMYLRIRASFYTVLFIFAIVISLIVSVFGNSISFFVVKHIPMMEKYMYLLIRVRTVFSLIVLTLFWDLAYKYLPDRTKKHKTTMRQQLPGAVFTSCGWLLISFVFSVYLDIFTGFSDMYGSLTTIILIMLWLYFCMYVILLGGELNAAVEGVTKRLKEQSQGKSEKIENA